MEDRSITRRDFGVGAIALSLSSTASGAPARRARRPWPYLIGADISWLPQQEARGATFFEDGKQKDALAILKDAGFNAIKLRLFVNPENGYSRRGSGPNGPWAGTAASVAFARRVKAAGFHLSFTLHYSDNWADPQHQDKPAAWASLPFPKLVDALHLYTRQTLAAFKAAGVRPDLVVLGNETTFGMLWPDGRVPLTIPTGNPDTDKVHMNVAGAGGFDNFAALLKAGIAAARKELPRVPIAVHNHLGRHWPIVRSWTDNLLQRGVRFDAVGFSCYQQAAEGDWARTFTEFEKRYPDKGFLVLEYSSRKRYLNDLVHAHPNGWGSYIWEPTIHQEAIFARGGLNAGGGPKPNLLSQGVNGAEAPGAAPRPSSATPAVPPPRPGFGGRFDAIPEFLQLYRDMARDYGLKLPRS
ncbi:MAG: glycosyl hydrolase 53 family protein [Sphingomicrobium sp.]